MSRLRTVVALVLLLLAISGLSAPNAQAADDLLVTSDPYRHQELTEPPSGVVLAFSRAVDAAAAQIVVTNSAGENVNVNSLIVEGTNVTAQVKPHLPEDTYTVHYQVNRPDGQVEGGAFQFSYGKGTWTALPDERWSGNSAQPTVIASAEPEPAPAPATTPAVSETPSATPPAPSATVTPPPPERPAGSDAASSPWPWAVAALLLAAGVGAIVWRRQTRANKPPTS